MTRLLSLLLLLLLCTGGRAQETPAPQNFGESATMVVRMDEASWMITASSAHEVLKRNYVMEHVAQRRLNRYSGFIPVAATERYDLQPVHEMINYLATKGWELTNSNHLMEWINLHSGGSYKQEVMTFYFRVHPIKGENASLVPVVLINYEDRMRLRGRMVKSAADTAYALIIEEQLNGQWQETFRLENEGIMAGDLPARMRSISISDDELVFKVKAEDGTYAYTFNWRAREDTFAFSGLQFRKEIQCGLINYKLAIFSKGKGKVSGQYYTDPCSKNSTLRAFEAFIEMEQTPVRAFSANTYRVDLGSVDKVLNY